MGSCRVPGCNERSLGESGYCYNHTYMKDPGIFNKMRDIFAEQSGVSADELDFNVNIFETYYIDSLDMTEFTMAIEEEFDLEIPDGELYGVTLNEFTQLIQSFLEAEQFGDVKKFGIKRRIFVKKELYELERQIKTILSSAVFDDYCLCFNIDRFDLAAVLLYSFRDRWIESFATIPIVINSNLSSAYCLFLTCTGILVLELGNSFFSIQNFRFDEFLFKSEYRLGSDNSIQQIKIYYSRNKYSDFESSSLLFDSEEGVRGAMRFISRLHHFIRSNHG